MASRGDGHNKCDGIMRDLFQVRRIVCDEMNDFSNKSMWTVRGHQFTVSEMKDSCNPIRTPVSGLMKSVSNVSPFENIHRTHPNAQPLVQSKLYSERTNETDSGPPVVVYS